MIGRGTHVRIKRGPFGGSFGIVRDLWLDDSHQPQLAVEFWWGDSGQFWKDIFPAAYLQLHSLPPVSREHFELLAVEQELETA